MLPAFIPSFTIDPITFEPGPMMRQASLGLIFGYYHHEAHAHVECAVHLSLIHIAQLLQECGRWAAAPGDR